ncbi:excisionase family DNA binding protein [Melghirimyces profundicolus]|uniref:Excisionase family DNA binding protein n=1 Tax=Melghirimyces profundicolus TaxID=1242148 RepID=A0A2T6AVJ4_9BACL|nr:helix-turn-helix domain-containing protein [Melghirimyces profundicolus]PTX47839.1 excisionase family DNA binding protein [Melghirimyces profundicolus]
MSKEVMNIEEAAQYLSISERTLYKMVKENRIPARKVGRQWRFHKDALDSWLKGEEKG